MSHSFPPPPQSADAFRMYLVDHHNDLRNDEFAGMLWEHAICNDNPAIMTTLLNNPHATWAWRHTRYGLSHVCANLMHLVKHGWYEAANIILSWSTTVAQFTEEDMMHLVKSPYRNGYEFMDEPLNVEQRNWILNHPALSGKTEKANNQ